jgi:hypothetical protein
VRRYSTAVTGGAILEPTGNYSYFYFYLIYTNIIIDRVEIMWRDKEREKQYGEPFGWYEATVLDIKTLYAFHLYSVCFVLFCFVSPSFLIYVQNSESNDNELKIIKENHEREATQMQALLNTNDSILDILLLFFIILYYILFFIFIFMFIKLLFIIILFVCYIYSF